MTDKTFTYAGYSTLNGTRKVRCANSADRVKVLMRCGHEDIDLRELPRPMSKDEARVFLGEPVAATAPRAPRAKKDTNKNEDVIAKVKARAKTSGPARDEKGRFIKKEQAA